MAQLNLKALFSADTKDIKKGSKEAQQAVSAFKDEAGNSFDQFANLFGTSMGQLSDHVKVFRGGLLMLSQSFKTTAAGSGVLTVALRVLKTALISTGIGALVVALGSLVAYFTKTQDGGDKLAKIMLQLKAVFGVITDIAAAVGRAISDAFSNPKQAVIDLWNAIKTNIVNRFTGLFQMFGSLAKLISAALKGNWDEVKQAAKEAGQNGVQIITGLDEKQQQSVRNYIAGKSAEVSAAAAAARRLADLQDEIDDKKRAWIKTEADLDTKLADLREKAADKEKYNVDQRLKYSREAEKVLQQLWNGRIYLAAQEYNAEKQIYNLKKEHTDEEEEQLNQLYATWRSLESQKSQELKGFHKEQLKIISQHQEEIKEKLENAAPDKDKLKEYFSKIAEFQNSLEGKIKETISSIDVDWDELLKSDKMLQDFQAIGKGLDSIMSSVNSSLSDFAVTIGEGIGNIIAGVGSLGDMGANILSVFGELMVTVGKIAIQAGVTMLGIQAMFANPFSPAQALLVVGAGILLVALGTAVKAGIQNAGSGNMSSATSYSSGSVSSSSSSAEYSSKEIKVSVSGELQSRGNKLIAVISNESGRKKLTS
jgi:hypothetical protein